MDRLAGGEMLESRYRVDTVIARGGMSTVYRCIDVRLGRTVAVKVLDHKVAADREATSRFKREARAMAQLNHPNLVNVYDTGSTGPHVFLVMELIDGGTLRELLAERGPMPPHAAVAVMEHVLTGLDVAHRAGMVHRDIKPDNILITTDGRVKLADFGLVRAADAARPEGAIHGTVNYLSPEQVRGEPISPASDVYQAGIVFFEMLTGTVPFTGDTPWDLANARLQHPVPDPSSRIDGVPPAIDALVATACAFAPADRFANAAVFHEAVTDTKHQLRLPQFTVPAPTHAAAYAAAQLDPGDPTSVVTTMLPADPAATTVIADDRSIPSTDVDAPHTGDTDDAATTILPNTETSVLPPPAPNITATSGPAPTDGATIARPTPAAAITPTTRQVSNRSAAKLIIWLIAVGVIVSCIALGAWWLGSGRYGEVPQVVGLGQAAAATRVEEAGYHPVVEPVWDNTHAPGSVLGTKPHVGARTSHGSPVAILVSRGQPTVPVIPADKDLTAYAKTLQDHSLNWTSGEQLFNRDIPAGNIVSVDPGPGALVPAGSRITIHLSKGPEPRVLPFLRGLPQSQAVERLKTIGFTVAGVREEYHPDLPPDATITTQPGPGTTAPAGSDVTLIINATVAIPNLIGLPLEDAQKRLDDAHIRVDKIMYSSTKGHASNEVLDTDPKPFSPVDPADPRITLMVTDQQRVPAVTGLAVKDAKKAIEDAHFLWEVPSSALDDDIVERQKPAAGSMKQAGTKIKLKIR